MGFSYHFNLFFVKNPDYKFIERSISMSSNIRIVEPSGILDSSKSEEFKQIVDSVLTSEAQVLLLDLKNITFVDSSGLGTLVVALKQLKAADRKMYICSINDQVRMLFELTSMDRVFDVLRDRQEFEHKIQPLFD